MANMFEKYAADREAEQKKIEQTVSADSVPAEDEKRTTLSLRSARRRLPRLSTSGSRSTCRRWISSGKEGGQNRPLGSCPA